MKIDQNLEHYITTKTLVENRKISTFSNKISLQFRQWFIILAKLILEGFLLLWFLFTLFFILIQISDYSIIGGSFISKYFDFLGNFFSGDLGYSSYYQSDVSSFIWTNISYTFLIIVFVIIFSSIFAILFSYLISIKDFKLKASLLNFLSVFSYAFPPFVFGILFLMISSQQKFIEGGQNFIPIFLTFFSLLISTSIFYTHLLAKSLNKEIDKKYFNFLYTKGLNESQIFRSHLILPILYYYIYYLPIIFITLLFNSIAIELLFNIPGISALLMTSINGSDEVLLIDCLMIYGTAFIIIFSLRGLFLKILDPKKRHIR